MMNLNKDIKIIEAILFASNEPVLEEDLIEKIHEKNKINEYLQILEEFYSLRGINLSKTGSSDKSANPFQYFLYLVIF